MATVGTAQVLEGAPQHWSHPGLAPQPLQQPLCVRPLWSASPYSQVPAFLCDRSPKVPIILSGVSALHAAGFRFNKEQTPQADGPQSDLHCLLHHHAAIRSHTYVRGQTLQQPAKR